MTDKHIKHDVRARGGGEREGKDFKPTSQSS